MPESNSYWFIASPLDGNPEEMTSELAAKVEGNNEMSVAGVTVPKATGTKLGSIGKVTLPEFKVGFAALVKAACSLMEQLIGRHPIVTVGAIRRLGQAGPRLYRYPRQNHRYHPQFRP